MKQRNSLFLSILLGVGLSLAPLRAQDNPPKEATPVAAQDPAQAQPWAGNLVDADCRATAPNDKCEVSEATKVFGLQTADGKYYRLDGQGNTKVMTALKSTDKPKTGAVKVSIAGSLNGSTLKVDTIEIR